MPLPDAFSIIARRAWPACAALLLWAAPSPADEPAAVATTNALWFNVGEELLYDIHWGVIHVGQTHVTTSWTNQDGRPLILVRYRTKTNGFVETFYPVDDTLESLIDPETFLPIYFKKKLSEGRYRCDETTRFDFGNLTMRWGSDTNGRKKTLPIEEDTRDIVTTMYYLRRQPFVQGETNRYRVMADERLYDLDIKVGRKETGKLAKWGARECHRVEPTASFDGLFVRKGKITFWVSTDPRQVCTRIMAEVPVANIRLTLADVKGPGEDFWVKSSKSKTKGSDDGD
jgi:hypothetical protein